MRFCVLLQVALLVSAVALASADASGAHGHEEYLPNVRQLTFAPRDATQTLTVSPDVLSSVSAYVTVSWSGIVNPQPADWIAAYSPPPTSPQGYLTTLPVKYQNLTADNIGVDGSIQFWLLHMRAPYVFVYMKGGFTAPQVITVSNVLTYTPEVANIPMQIHLARTADPKQMRVTWTTRDTQAPVVRFAPAAKMPGQMVTVAANTSTYTRDQMCAGEGLTPSTTMAGSLGWRDPGAIHTAIMDDLQAGVEYAYQVGDFGLFSPVLSFFAAPPAGADVDFTIMGDFGQAEFDGSIGWEEWTRNDGKVVVDIDQPASINTSLALRNDLVDGSVQRNSSIVLLIGDVSYARGREALWDQWAYLTQPYATMVPLMTAIGNHEFDYNASLFVGDDSGGECGIALQTRLPMPSPPMPSGFPKPTEGFSDSPWYSFEHGAVHFVLLSSEHDFNRSGAQYAWLSADLASVDRSRTPWLIVSSHRPMYVSSTSNGRPSSDMGGAAWLRQELEPLLLKYRVDAFFAGHHHSQQRTCAVANQVCADATSLHRNRKPNLYAGIAAEDEATPSFGIVHVVTGAAGQWCNTFLDPDELPWLLFANTQVHGYTRAHVRGNELTLDFVASSDRSVWDSVTIVQQPGQAPLLRRNPSKTYQPTAATRPTIILHED